MIFEISNNLYYILCVYDFRRFHFFRYRVIFSYLELENVVMDKLLIGNGSFNSLWFLVHYILDGGPFLGILDLIDHDFGLNLRIIIFASPSPTGLVCLL